MKKNPLFKDKGNMPDRIFRERILMSPRRLQHPKVPFLIFTPIALGLLAYCIWNPGIDWLLFAGGLGGAVLFWTIYEYIVHRYFFHMQPRSSFWRKLLYSVHIAHHDYPNDKRLMLIGPEVSIPGFLIFYGLFYLLLGHPAVHAFMFGMVSCYLAYDWLHFAAHNYHFKNKLFQYYQRHHLEHHFRDNEKNYGFTTTVWDEVMGTKIKD